MSGPPGHGSRHPRSGSADGRRYFSTVLTSARGADPTTKPFFLGSGIDLSAAFEGKLCKGAPRGPCARTGRPHHILAGTNSKGHFLTKLAEPYPINMCNAIARIFETTIMRTKPRNFISLLKGEPF